MKRLVVVGNAPPSDDWSEPVDACDVVIRFNTTPHFGGGLTGSKTTVLCLFGIPDPNRATRYRELEPRVVAGCREIWVWGPALVERLADCYGVPARRVKVRTEPFSQLDQYTLTEVGRLPHPSSGLLVLRFVLNAAAWAGYEKYLCGFDWSGRVGRHRWDLEKKQVGFYMALGLIRPLV